MKIEKIKPIPKYMIKAIQKADKKHYPEQSGYVRYYDYFTKNDKELVQVTVAVKNSRSKWYCKQVSIHGIHSEKCFVKDMSFSYLGGYSVGWYSEGLQRYAKWFEDNEWGWHYDKYFNPYAYIINKDYITKKFPEYKYSAIELSYRSDIFKYLRLYEQFPQMEYLTKLGLHSIVFSKQILSLLKKDNKFRAFIIKNKDIIETKSLYIEAILMAYKRNIPLIEANNFLTAKIKLSHDKSKAHLREEFKNDLEKFFKYIAKQETSIESYADYLKACKKLGLDMNDEKNRYPHDFKYWHDIRIDQYYSLIAQEEAEMRKEMEQKFAQIVLKYLSLEYTKQNDYITIIAHTANDLVKEGEKLHHCVGRMGYDQKMIRGETLIFFIRLKDKPNKPLVTLEYSPTKKKILQCYGKNNTKPSDEILDFVNNHWLPYANRKIRKIAA